MQDLTMSLLITLQPALLGGIAGGGLGYVLSKYAPRYAIIEWMPWRTAVAVLVFWWAEGIPAINMFGLGMLSGMVTMALLAFVIALAAVVSASLESTPQQRAINTTRSSVIAAMIIGIRVTYLTGGGGLGARLYEGLQNASDIGFASAQMVLIAIALLFLVVDLFGGLVQSRVAKAA